LKRQLRPLIALVAPAMIEPVLLALTTWATETIRPGALFQATSHFWLVPVELNKLGTGQAGPWNWIRFIACSGRLVNAVQP